MYGSQDNFDNILCVHPFSLPFSIETLFEDVFSKPDIITKK